MRLATETYPQKRQMLPYMPTTLEVAVVGEVGEVAVVATVAEKGTTQAIQTKRVAATAISLAIRRRTALSSSLLRERYMMQSEQTAIITQRRHQLL